MVQIVVDSVDVIVGQILDVEMVKAWPDPVLEANLAAIDRRGLVLLPERDEVKVLEVRAAGFDLLRSRGVLHLQGEGGFDLLGFGRTLEMLMGYRVAVEPDGFAPPADLDDPAVVLLRSTAVDAHWLSSPS
jgi:hypothetical protein